MQLDGQTPILFVIGGIALAGFITFVTARGKKDSLNETSDDVWDTLPDYPEKKFDIPTEVNTEPKKSVGYLRPVSSTVVGDMWEGWDLSKNVAPNKKLASSRKKLLSKRKKVQKKSKKRLTRR